jgi:hypothetical protein
MWLMVLLLMLLLLRQGLRSQRCALDRVATAAVVEAVQRQVAAH